MAGVTNAPFRLVARECGAGRLTSEEIDARALVRDNARTVALTAYLPEERPLAMQLLGEDPDLLAEGARRLETAGADGIDLNMGCPVAKVDAVRIPVVGNGDVSSVDDARAMVAATGCASVMIGRGALGRPWIFRGVDVPRDARATIIRRHCALIEAHLPERAALVQLKKHLAWYSDGLPFAARSRPAIFAARTPAEVADVFWRLWGPVSAGSATS